jgi:Abortive infection C-terminus
MSATLISAGTRVDFREALTSFTLQQIRDIFATGDFEPNLDHQPPVSGQRRTLIEQYFVNIDLTDPRDMKRLLSVFEELLLRLGKGPDWDTIQTQQVTINNLQSRMESDGFTFENGRFASNELTRRAVSTPLLISLTEESITEHREKANLKIEAGDASGAITSAYTLVEGFLKQMYKTVTGNPFKESEGDIRALYGAVAGQLNLTPKGETLESYLKAILQGSISQIGGLYELANKAGDRHVGKYKPARHHAQLAVNIAFTLCEFVLASYHYQKHKQSKKATA